MLCKGTHLMSEENKIKSCVAQESQDFVCPLSADDYDYLDYRVQRFVYNVHDIIMCPATELVIVLLLKSGRLLLRN